VIDQGLLTRRQLRSSAWQRLFQGVYADSSLAVTHTTRCAAVAGYLLPAGGVIAGRSAVMVHGAGLAGPLDPVEALAPRGTEVIPHDGVIVHRANFFAEECVRLRGLIVTSPVRTCWDVALWLSPVEAVVLVDRMLAKGRVTIGQLRRYLDQRLAETPRSRGWRRFARIVGLVDGRAESPQESRLRVRFVLAGLPPPVVQFTIRTEDGEFVARVDLAWPEFRLAVEYDGLWHGESRSQIHRDRQRQNAIHLKEWLVLYVTSESFRDDFDGIVANVRAAMRQRAATL
jgi:hypothetical protein